MRFCRICCLRRYSGIVCRVSGRLRLDLFFWQREQQFLSFLCCGRLAWPAKRHLQQLDRTYSVLFRWPRKQKRWPERRERGDRGGGERQTDKVTEDTKLWQGGQMQASISSFFFFFFWTVLGCRLMAMTYVMGLELSWFQLNEWWKLLSFAMLHFELVFQILYAILYNCT